jgi:catechol 2,3-dioxygenase-like lactoylglutathione lyase family enzyme
MLASCEVVAFIATANAERARAFYAGTLGLTLVADERVALVFDAHGVTLRIAKVDAFTPQPFTVLGWRVEDIASMVENLTARGVVFERFAGMTQDDAGIWTSPDGSRVAWFKDPDGNLLSVTRR